MTYFRSTRFRNAIFDTTPFASIPTTIIVMTQETTFRIEDRVIITSPRSTWHNKIGVVKKVYESGLFGVILDGDSQAHMRRFSIVGIRKYYCYDVERLPVANDIIHERVRVLETKVTQLQRQLRRVLTRINTSTVTTATTSMRTNIPNIIVDDCSVH
jgi:hypothetical protein